MSKTYKEKLAEFTDDMVAVYKAEPSQGTTNILGVNPSRGDGGFTDYYAIPIHATQLSDLIYHKNMNHSIGEAFCALYRMNDNGEKVRNIKKVIRYMELELTRL